MEVLTINSVKAGKQKVTFPKSCVVFFRDNEDNTTSVFLQGYWSVVVDMSYKNFERYYNESKI